MTESLAILRYADQPMTHFPATKAYADRLVERPAMKRVLAAVAEAYKNRK